MKFEEYRRFDAIGLAELVAKGEVTAAELLACAESRATQINPTLNAIVISMAEIGHQRAHSPLQGAFAGVPFLIKDIAQDYAGVPTTAGSRAMRYFIPATHSEYVQRCLNAGLVIFGKTNTPELALKGTTEPAYWGPTLNPWNPAYSAGGSSGGAAAAIAAGIVPMAGASDGGGSIRIPASHCGLFGLRPSRGRVPAGPAHAEFWHGASSEHVICRSVRDSAAMLDALAGPDIGAPFHIAPPKRPFSSEVNEAPGKLRIAFSASSPIHRNVHGDCVRAMEETVELLRDLGHVVEEARPNVDGEALARCYITMYMGQTAANVRLAVGKGAKENEFEPETRALALLGESLSAAEYSVSLMCWNEFARALGQFFQRYDLYLTPTVAAPPARIGEQNTPYWQQLALAPVLNLGLGKALRSSGQVEALAFESLARVPFTQLSNLTGTPSMSVPLYWNDKGLPIGSQFIAPFGEEARLIRLAAQLEKARPWFYQMAE